MARLASDVKENKALVKGLFFVDGKPRDESNEQTVKDCYKRVLELLEVAGTATGRKQVVHEVTLNSFDVALWKAIVPLGEWLDFLTQLKERRVTTTDITLIKQIVNDAFEILLEDALEVEREEKRLGLIEVEVKEFSARKGGQGIIISYRPV